MKLTLTQLWLAMLALTVLSGVVAGGVLANASIDYSLHDTYYVVAHGHAVWTWAAPTAVFAALYRWFQPIVGASYCPRLAFLHFALHLAAWLLVFAPQHLMALQPMPKRYVDYPEQFAVWNQVSTAGYGLLILSLAAFAAVIVEARLRRRRGAGQ